MTFLRALLLSSGLLLSASASAFATSQAAPPHPAVKLHLTGDLIVASGDKTVATPVDKAVLKKGDVVRYTIVAQNSGGKSAVAVSTVGPVPQRTQFVAGSASHQAGALIEYSLDGKSWSAQPMVVVNTPRGPVQKAADPAQYVAVRWTAQHPLAPKQSLRYSYEVRVK